LDQSLPYWSRDPADLLREAGSGPAGLSAAEAQARLRRVGPNAVEEGVQFTALQLLLRQYESPLVLILVFGAAVSLLVRDWIDAAIILVVVIGSTLLGFAQEYRASAAMAALRRRIALTAQVVREGTVRTVPVVGLVPGDVIRLSAGNLVPADGVVLSAKDFLVAEAALTGESFPVEKRPGVLAPDAPIAQRTNCVFLGTSVRSGEATVLIVETGMRTAFGAVAARLKARAPETEFAHGVRQFGYLLVRIMVVMVLFVLTVNQLLGRPAIESLLFAVALAVGLSPELLPAIVTVTLSAGARAMARRGVIVRRLEAIENLGSIDVLCTDKTGTLTEGTIDLIGTLDPDGQPSPELRRLAFLNSAFETGIDNPLDAAILATLEREGMSTRGYTKVDEIPYDFIRKRLTIVVAEDAVPGRHLIVSKGAFENILEVCSAIGDAEREQLQAFYARKGAEGSRVLGVAVKQVPAKGAYARGDEQGMSFAGFLLFFDPPKPEAQQTIRDLSALGVQVRIISGDNRYVTAHVAKAIGLDGQAILTGAEIAGMRDEALWHAAERTDLFVEVDPQQKERIVRALQRTGHAVGYMGDGINDAPALHAADVGISVDQAVDVARESADVILLQRDLDVLRTGVTDGRRTFVNTLKYINITTSANFGNMVSMALATPLLPFLPLSAKQILLNNFLSDLPSVAISADNVDADRVLGAQRWNVAEVRRFMVVFGLISSAFDVITFGLLWFAFAANEATFQTAWFVVSLLTELAVVLVLRTRGPAWRSKPGRILLWTTVVVTALSVLLPYAGPLATAFGFVALPGATLAAMLLVVLAYIVATEIAKRWFFGRHRNHS
jgi:Mg2+-importing ATPase